MNPYVALIQQEEQKLELLKLKVQQCENRIATLRSLVDADGVDEALSKQLGQAREVKKPKGEKPKAIPSGSLRVRSDSVALTILPYVGADGKTLSEIDHYMNIEQSKEVHKGSLRTALMNLRVKHGLIENPRKGFYKLSEAGLLWLEEYNSTKREGELEL